MRIVWLQVVLEVKACVRRIVHKHVDGAGGHAILYERIGSVDARREEATRAVARRAHKQLGVIVRRGKRRAKMEVISIYIGTKQVKVRVLEAIFCSNVSLRFC